jgi:arylsulfatase A-like enzyme
MSRDRSRVHLTRRQLLASAGLGGAAVLGGGAFAFLREDSRAEAIRAAAAARAQVAQRGMSVVLICLDSVRADHVGAYRTDRVRPRRPAHTPSLDELARGSLRFTHARPEQLPTGPTRRSLHTGIRTFPADGWRPDPDSPRIYGWQRIPEAQATLSELFGAAGYRTAMVTDNTWMLKPSWRAFSRTWGEFLPVMGQVQQSLPKGRSIDRVDVSRYLPDGLRALGRKAETNRDVIARYVVNRGERRREEDWFAPRVFTEAARWLERNGNAPEGFFLFIDSFDPHEPWDPPRKYVERYDDPDPRVKDAIFPVYGRDDYLSEREIKRMKALYAGELTMTDHWLGVFLERLDQLGLASRTLVVVFSDHGVSLADRGFVGKSPSQMYAEMVDVPLLVRHPEGRAAGTSTGFLASLHDLAPTLLSAAGVPVPEAMEGIDLTPLLAGTQPARERKIQTAAYNDYVWAGTAELSMVASGRGRNRRLFDRTDDPGERRNLAGARSDDAERLWKRVLADAGGRSLPRYD